MVISRKTRAVLKVVVQVMAVALFVLCGNATVYGQSGYLVAAPRTNANWGHSDPDWLTPVLMFNLDSTGTLQTLTPIAPYPSTDVVDPSWAAFNSNGELFIANRHGNDGGLPDSSYPNTNPTGSIARFKLGLNGEIVANGVITGNELNAVHGLAFNSDGELFAANYLTGFISRFTFDAEGTAVPNGTINVGTGVTLGLAFAPNGDLYAAHGDNRVTRIHFSGSNSFSMESLYLSGAWGIHGLTFGPGGELFLADLSRSCVWRTFPADGPSLIPSGSIPVPGGAPFGVALTKDGFLLVSSHFSSGLHVFGPDGAGGFVQVAAAETDSLGGLAVLEMQPPPVALCKDVTAVADSYCSASASVDNGSYSPNGDPITLAQSPEGPYPLGATSVTLTATDSVGASSQCSGMVTVLDTTPPVISQAFATPSEIWPPNKKMVNVTVNYNSTDNCGQAACRITSVTSNEPITTSDYAIVDAHHVKLSADRLGNGNGRIYTIGVTCTDASGNSSTQTTTVTIPHDQGKK
jgi:hypothetical protein